MNSFRTCGIVAENTFFDMKSDNLSPAWLCQNKLSEFTVFCRKRKCHTFVTETKCRHTYATDTLI